MGQTPPAPDEDAGPNASAISHADAASGAFRTLLESVRRRVDARLADLLAERVAEAAGHGPDTAAMVGAVRSLTLRGGKRFRPAMVLAAYAAAGGELGERAELAVIEAGAALELLQTYLLVHDDWMDGDETRRGGPSVHALLQAHFGDRARGDASAILAGDHASALSQECLARAVSGRRDAAEIFHFFARMQQQVILGQQLDLSGRSEDVEAMHQLKTGAYTVRGPLRLGALFASASEQAAAALDRYAAPLGVAFQLRDDLLGAFGEPAETGKPFGNDLRAGKRTAVVAEAEAGALLGEGGRATLAAVFGRATATDAELRAASRALDSCGARAAVEARLDALVGQALGALREAPLSPAGALVLEGAASALTARRS
jgi:geranylgeranyl diphosphate synthase, type I